MQKGQIPSRSTNNAINFVNSAEFFPSTTHSGNLELNSKFSNKVNNKFRVSFTDVVDDRGPTGSPFPAVSLQSFNGGPTINFGTEAASSANLLKQRIINFYDAFKYYTGKNAITVGADFDLNKSYNLFMNRALSLYGYNNLALQALLKLAHYRPLWKTVAQSFKKRIFAG